MASKGFVGLFGAFEPPLPREIEELEVLPQLPAPYLFVLAKVNRHFHDRFGDVLQPTSPLESFALHGHVTLVRWDQQGPGRCPLTSTVFRQAARGGSLAVLKELQSLKCPADPRALKEAAISGDLGVIDFLLSLELRSSVRDDHAFCAARNGLLPLMRFTEAGAKVDRNTLISAAESGERAAVEFLLEALGLEDLSGLPKVIPALANAGDVDLLRWALTKLAPITDPNIYVVAAKHGHVNILNFAKEYRIPYGPTSMLDAVDKAMENGQVAALHWLLSNNNVHPVRTAWVRAISNNHFDLVKFGIEKDLVELRPIHFTAAIGADPRILALLEDLKCPSDQSSLAKAVRTRRYDLVARLRKKGIEWNNDCMEAAILSGNTAFLKSLPSQGYEIPSSALNFAIRNGACFDTLNFLETEQKLTYDSFEAIRALMVSSHPEVARFLRQSKGFVLPSDPVHRFPAWWRRPQVVRLFLCKGIVLKESIAMEAATLYNRDLLSFLEGHQCPMDLSAMRAAVQSTVPFEMDGEVRKSLTLEWIDACAQRHSFLARIGLTKPTEKSAPAPPGPHNVSQAPTSAGGFFESLSATVTGWWH